MSRIGKKVISIPNGVKIEQKDLSIKVTGPLGSLQTDCYPCIKVKIDNSAGIVSVENENDEIRRNRQLHGTMRALIANMITGVSRGFEKQMMVYGTGYNVKEQGGKLILNIGFCHPIEIPIPKGIKVNIQIAATKGNDVPAKFSFSGIDKRLLGQFASDIRRVRPPEPYKGKGVRYADEHVKRKVGKAFTSGTA